MLEARRYLYVLFTCQQALEKIIKAFEIKAYTPEDLKEARPTNFLGHILETGKIVYKSGKLRI